LTDIKTKIKRNVKGRRTDRVKLREHEYILRLLAKGKKIAEIARITERSPSTIKNQLLNIRTEKATPTQKRYSETMKLLKALEQLTGVPEPETKLLPIDEQRQEEIVGAILSGDGKPYVSAIQTSMNTPWWSSKHKVELNRHLSYDQETVLVQLLESSQSEELDYAFEIWERNAEAYRKLKMDDAEAKYLITAYYGAQQAADALHKQLKQAAATVKY